MINLSGLAAEQIDQVSFNVNWSMIHNDPNVKFTLRYKPADNWEYISFEDIQAPFLVDNLDPDRTYVIEVLAKNDLGILWSNSVLVRTEEPKPPPPEGII